jgi:hypothetical protein
MPDLQKFREKVTLYRKRRDTAAGKPYTQAELANAIGLSADELGHRLRGTGRSNLTSENVFAIVNKLAEWRTLTWKEAVDLLTSMDDPIDQPRWKIELQQHLSPPVNTLALQDTFLTNTDGQKDAERLAQLHATRIDSMVPPPFDETIARIKYLKGMYKRFNTVTLPIGLAEGLSLQAIFQPLKLRRGPLAAEDLAREKRRVLLDESKLNGQDQRLQEDNQLVVIADGCVARRKLIC